MFVVFKERAGRARLAGLQAVLGTADRLLVAARDWDD
jgi:hypothetical protein